MQEIDFVEASGRKGSNTEACRDDESGKHDHCPLEPIEKGVANGRVIIKVIDVAVFHPCEEPSEYLTDRFRYRQGAKVARTVPACPRS